MGGGAGPGGVPLTASVFAFLPSFDVAVPPCSQQRAMLLQRLHLRFWGGENFQRYKKHLDPVRNMRDFP